MFRGTFRYPHWCVSLDAIKATGMTSYEKKIFIGKTYKEVVADQIKETPENISAKIARKLKIEQDSPAIQSMDWLGLFSDKKVDKEEASPFDLTCELMMEKMMLPEKGRDMVVMLHSFLVETAEGKKEVIKSRLLDFSTDTDTSIARTVALPAAIASRMILEGKIRDTGVHIPIAKSIYDPVLDELENMNISMVEEWGLSEEEQIGKQAISAG